MVRNALVHDLVEITPQGRTIHTRRSAKHLDGRLSGYKTMAAQRQQLADWGSVAADDEGLPLIKPPHDSTTVIPELALRDLLGHRTSVALRATH
jgi:hypothetical protein